MPDKEFAGASQGTRGEGPVQFEKEEDDPFGLTEFLTDVKNLKRSADEGGSKGRKKRG